MTAFFFLLTLVAHAQWESAPWLHLEGAYGQRETKESERLNVTARRALARGELGLNVLPHLAISAAARYQDGLASATGRTLTDARAPASVSTRTFETRALAHLIYRGFVVSGGLGQLDASGDVAGNYRTHERFDFKPVLVTVHLGPAYLRVEHDLWTKGSGEVRLSDLGDGRKDLTFALTKATGQGAEVGVLWPARVFATKIFVAAHRWTIDAVAARSDGVGSVGLPKTVITQVEAGLGLAF